MDDFIKTNASVDSIVLKIEEINTLSSHNTRSVEEIASASETLNTLTESLNATLSKFKTH